MKNLNARYYKDRSESSSLRSWDRLYQYLCVNPLWNTLAEKAGKDPWISV